MRVFISADMEGCTGIVHNDQLVPGGADYQRGRELMTRDVATAASAALAMDDVEYVRIADGHGTMRNLLVENLPAGCDVVIGPASSRTLCQMEGIDDSFGAVLFVGYHARVGTERAVLPHTWVGSVVSGVRVNGRPFGEATLNAGIAGEFGVPVVFLSGDVAACRQAREDLGDDLVTVAVKDAVGPKAAICRTPADTEGEIRIGVLTALQDAEQRKPYRVEGPVQVAVSFHRVEMAARAASRPGAERTGSHELTLSRETFLEAAKELWRLIEWTAGDHPEWLR